MYGDDRYAVTFVNGEEAAFLPVPIESARALAGQLRRDRRVTLKMNGELVRAKRKGFSGYDRNMGMSYTDWRKTLEVMLSSIEATMESGTVVATTEVKARPDLVKTCEQIAEDCSNKIEACKQGCREEEDLMVKTLCLGDCRDLSNCASLEGC